jgi:hypothetical protein
MLHDGRIEILRDEHGLCARRAGLVSHILDEIEQRRRLFARDDPTHGRRHPDEHRCHNRPDQRNHEDAQFHRDDRARTVNDHPAEPSQYQQQQRQDGQHIGVAEDGKSAELETVKRRASLGVGFDSRDEVFVGFLVHCSV